MKNNMAKYRGRGTQYRGYSPYRRGSYSSYRTRGYDLYSPYRARRGSFSPYSRLRRQDYEWANKPDRTAAETGYVPRPERQGSDGQPSGQVKKYELSDIPRPELVATPVAPGRLLWTKEELFEHFPPRFPEHWDKDPELKKAVMEQPPEVDQEKLIEIINEKGKDSAEGKAAYEQLLKIQLEEINKAEDEYRAQAELKADQNGPERMAAPTENERAERAETQPAELSQTEIEETMEQLEGELLEPERFEADELEENAESVAEQALQDTEELEGLVQEALEDTIAESSELGPELGSELGIEDEKEEEEEGY